MESFYFVTNCCFTCNFDKVTIKVIVSRFGNDCRNSGKHQLTKIPISTVKDIELKPIRNEKKR